jgi:pimeloyl-ACP methyl ester carboxylesterase
MGRSGVFMRQAREVLRVVIGMQKLGSISYEVRGGGASARPPLVLVHGSFSDHDSNWELVSPAWEREFRVIAIARRGRGESAKSVGHSLGDEARDVAKVLTALEAPATLLGHSYGAHVALLAARMEPERVAKLILYEPPRTGLFCAEAMARLSPLAGDWDRFASVFFGESLLVPLDELREVRASGAWAAIVADAPASWQDIQALARYEFRAADFAGLGMPVLLQTGSESPAHLYATGDLAETLQSREVMRFEGQAHEAMTTAPETYARRVAEWVGAARPVSA